MLLSLLLLLLIDTFVNGTVIAPCQLKFSTIISTATSVLSDSNTRCENTVMAAEIRYSTLYLDLYITISYCLPGLVRKSNSIVPRAES